MMHTWDDWVAPVCLTLYEQRCIRCENVFTPCGRGPQGIPMSPHPRCVAKSKSQGRHSVHISWYGLFSCKPRHEGTGPGFTSPGKRFSYVFVKTYSLLIGASLQNSKLPKVNRESKSSLAYHLLRLLWSLYGLIHVSSPVTYSFWK
jgi:hypothetical protein